ncbi:hypothetical protein D9Q98_000746 [Chlorella vulgaris]|uniref:GATA-type domain-containing protein n=1 Tax=Chlorella vulgaris TaxID=3077 RepID=A0A9D4TYX1_CHLVU|nr:hypothetical protein D9Q98_000746 [Chlorella vulgaris]
MPSSGAGGPCNHCGRTNSCCWRRGPTNKPVLCNACGSRYLVKRNLDNYVPLATRQDRAKETGGAKETDKRRVVAPAAGRVTKPKRAVQKRVNADAWGSDAEDSDASTSACLTDDSSISQLTAEKRTSRAAAVASKLKLSYITSQSPLDKELESADLTTLTGAFFAGGTLRLKPRKPMVVTVSAVW